MRVTGVRSAHLAISYMSRRAGITHHLLVNNRAANTRVTMVRTVSLTLVTITHRYTAITLGAG